MTDNEIIAERYIHSCNIKFRKKQYYESAVVVKIHAHRKDGSVTPEFRIHRNPKRTIWISKAHIQALHDRKREWEALKNLDTYIVDDASLTSEIFRIFNGYYPSGYISLRDACESPYLYGADVSIETLVHKRYADKFNKTGLSPAPLTRGMFDIEADIGTNEITLATYCHESEVYTAVLSSRLRKTGKTVKDLEAMAHHYIRPGKAFTDTKKVTDILEKEAFTYTFHEVSGQVELLKWIFGKMHERKTDMVGVWNMAYDLDQVFSRLKIENVNAADVLADPGLPSDLKRARLVVDRGHGDAHFVKRWPWVHAPSHTALVDSMSLYGILRLVQGFEESYALDHILRINGVSDGKLDFSDDIPVPSGLSGPDWHRTMTEDFFAEYAIYNVFDVVSMMVLERMNNDMPALSVLSRYTPLHNFNRQTRRAQDVLFFKLKEEGRIIATKGVPEDEEDGVLKVGGAVLPAGRAWGLGVDALAESDIETFITTHTSDIDLSALYPTVTISVNISQETKKGVLTSIEGMSLEDIQEFTVSTLAIRENAVPAVKRFYGGPGYAELEDLMYARGVRQLAPYPKNE